MLELPLHIPQSLTPLTSEEESLLALYASVKTYEREAAKAQSAAAKKKLAEAEVKYQKEQQQRSGKQDEYDLSDDRLNEVQKEHSNNESNKKNTERKSRLSPTDNNRDIVDNDNANSDNSNLDVPSDDVESNDDESMQSEQDDALKSHEEELEAARAEERERQKHLANDGTGNSDVDEVVLIQKKKKRKDNSQEKSLISNMKISTPRHEFSEGLGMTKVSLTGSMLFPNKNDVSALSEWSPPLTAKSPDEESLVLELPGLDLNRAALGDAKNTLAIKFTAPIESSRFSINITLQNHENYRNVLFHFNPRQHQRGGQLVLNHKSEGMWGQGINIPLSTLPVMFGKDSSTLVVQINGDGFDVFVDGTHCARLEHKTPLPEQKCSLSLQLPSTDDYGTPENWTVHKIWWGNKPMRAKGDLSNIPGVNTFDSIHPRKLFISGLSKISENAEVDLRRAELERAFRNYGGAKGAIVTVPTNSTFAFVELETDRQADLALSNLSGQYKLNRARRSRHEALLEQRALEESSGTRTTKESSEWD